MTAVGPHTGDYHGAGFELALGEIYGLRTWLVDDYGRLRARHISAAPPWRPGINEAVCHHQHTKGGTVLPVIADPSGQDRIPDHVDVISTGGGYAYRIRWDDGSEDTISAVLIPDTRVVPHQPVPDERCYCGFYAYTYPVAQTWSVDSPSGVLGVIRGSGRTVIGAKGFKTQKAEILALLDPTAAREPGPAAGWIRDRLRLIYPDVPLLDRVEQLLDFAPIESTAPLIGSDEFWALP